MVSPKDLIRWVCWWVRWAALSVFYDDEQDFGTEEAQLRHICRSDWQCCGNRCCGASPQCGPALCVGRSRVGVLRQFFEYVVWCTEGEVPISADPVLERALEVLLILHADHGQNLSTSIMRGVASGGADPYSSMAGAAAALYGPAHGGANEAVLNMLNEIGSVDKVPAYIERVENKEVVLQGFGHRVYKNYDPRAAIVKETAYSVFEVTGKNPLIDIALELERIALQDEYFISRQLYPNVDFYSGIIYQAIGLPTRMMTVLFAVGRSCGWLAQWKEMLWDSEQKIARPRQIYTGADKRDYVGMGQR